MTSAFDFPFQPACFAMFCCQLDSALTLTEHDSQLADLLGTTLPIHESNALTEFICASWVERTLLDIRQQLSNGDDVEFIFPVHCDNSSIRWLLCRGRKFPHPELSEGCIRGVLVDITTLKGKYDKNRHIIEQYQTILAQTGEVMFEWDITADTMQFSEGWKSKFGYTPQTAKFTKVIAQGGHVHPEDAQYLLTQLHLMQGGRSFLDLEIRIADKQNQWLWCKIRACGIYDISGNLTYVIGLIIDIDDEKKARRALQAQAEQDSLTKLLNAHTTRLLVEQYLLNCGEQTHCAMLILDLDDFKRINDRYGHLSGDEVLVHVADILKHSFRTDDIVGRVGGEEFLVLIKNVSDPHKIIDRCSHLLEAIRVSSLAYALTASIGVGIVSGRETRYDELFLRADEALYQAKRAGKNQYILSK